MTRKSKKGADTPAVQFDPKPMEASVSGPLMPAEANALIYDFKKALFERNWGQVHIVCTRCHKALGIGLARKPTASTSP